MQTAITQVVLMLIVFLIVPLSAAPQERAEDILNAFSKAWPAKRKDYRTEGDDSWKSYALTLRALVAMGDKAVPALTSGLTDANRHVRALSARALGFLEAKSAAPALVAVLNNDKWRTARLMAADALGQINDPAGRAALEKARAVEKNGDVLLHIGRALERQNTGLEKGVREQILKINAQTIDLAKIGHPAPDFTLADSKGNTYSLVQFKGQRPVVLVFNYGDG